MEFYRKQFSDFIYFPPTSNLEATRIMQDHDALILPSIIEGELWFNRKRILRSSYNNNAKCGRG